MSETTIKTALAGVFNQNQNCINPVSETQTDEKCRKGDPQTESTSQNESQKRSHSFDLIDDIDEEDISREPKFKRFASGRLFTSGSKTEGANNLESCVDFSSASAVKESNSMRFDRSDLSTHTESSVDKENSIPTVTDVKNKPELKVDQTVTVKLSENGTGEPGVECNGEKHDSKNFSANDVTHSDSLLSSLTSSHDTLQSSDLSNDTNSESRSLNAGSKSLTLEAEDSNSKCGDCPTMITGQTSRNGHTDGKSSEADSGKHGDNHTVNTVTGQMSRSGHTDGKSSVADGIVYIHCQELMEHCSRLPRISGRVSDNFCVLEWMVI